MSILVLVHTFSVAVQATADHHAMDRRRLEMAHMNYTVPILNVCGWYPTLIKHI